MYKNKGGINTFKGDLEEHETEDEELSIEESNAIVLDLVLIHITLGKYNSNNRPNSGGHSQEATDYMDEHNIPYEINIVYKNGVRRGNLPTSTEKMKKEGNIQSWFPKSWTREDIKNAIIEAAKSYKGKPKSGTRHTAVVNGVSITIIFGENGKIESAYPSKDQPGGIKDDN